MGSKFDDGGNYYINPVSIIQHEPPQRQTSSAASRHQLQPMAQQTRIEIVQPTIITTSTTTSHDNFGHLAALPATSTGGHIIHYQHQQSQPSAIHLEQPFHSASTSSRAIALSPNLSPIDQKVLLQKAKRAERARRRFVVDEK